MTRPRSRIEANTTKFSGISRAASATAMRPGPVNWPAEKKLTARCASNSTSKENKTRLELKRLGQKQAGSEHAKVV